MHKHLFFFVVQFAQKYIAQKNKNAFPFYGKAFFE